MERKWMLLVATGFCIALLHGQTPAKEPLPSARYTFFHTPDLRKSPPSALDSTRWGGDRLLVVTFDRLPDAKTRSVVAAAGVYLGDCLYSNTFLAKVPDGVLLSDLGIIQAGRIPAYQKWTGPLPGPLAADADSGQGAADVLAGVFPGLNPGALVPVLQALGWNARLDHGFIRVGLPADQLPALAAQPWVLYLEPWPSPPQWEGNGSRQYHGVPQYHAYRNSGLDGSGVSILFSEDGSVAHPDLADRLIDLTGKKESKHAPASVGMAVGNGAIDPLAEGIAPKATPLIRLLEGYDQITQAATYYSTYGVTLTSNSFGDGCGGFYNSFARLLDEVSLSSPKVGHIFSAGNSSIFSCSNTYSWIVQADGRRWGNITGGLKTGKNALVVGNIDSNGALDFNSSRGPAADGRIKPDICAFGQGDWTLAPSEGYQISSGSSAAAPVVAGIAALLYQQYRQMRQTDPDFALIKSLLLNTAKDLGRPGPDFEYGFGAANAFNALTALQNQWYLSGSVAHGQTQTHVLPVPAGVKTLKVLLYWHDAPGSPLAAKALVNDLDLEVTDAAGKRVLPQVLSSASHPDSLLRLAAPGADRLNNAEQVVLSLPSSGTYAIRVKGYEIPQGPQPYYLTYYFDRQPLEWVFPVPGTTLVPGETVKLRWEAPVSDPNPIQVEYSLDKGASWKLIRTLAPGAGALDWVAPEGQDGRLALRLKQSAGLALCDNLSLLATPNFQLTNLGGEAVEVRWNPVKWATRYEVLLLRDSGWQVAGATTQLALTLGGLPSGAAYWMTVRAAIPEKGLMGRRAIAQKYIHQSCAVQARLKINTGANPAALRWEVRDIKGELLAVGGPYAQQHPFSYAEQELCLPPGCAILKITTDNGKTACCADNPIAFQVFDAQGREVASGPYSGAGATAAFCLQSASGLGVKIVSSKAISCAKSTDGALLAVAEGGSGKYTFQWSSGHKTAAAAGLKTGTYTVTVSDGHSARTAQYFLEEPARLTLSLSPEDARCYRGSDGRIQALPEGGTPPYALKWNTGSAQVAIASLPAGTYQATVTDSKGCMAASPAVIRQPDSLSVEVFVLPDGKSLQANGKGGTAPYQFSWPGGQTGQVAGGLSPGLYRVTATDAHGCSAFAEAVLPGPSTLAYCPLAGVNTQFEWIASVGIGNFKSVSGNNQGYAYFPSLPVNGTGGKSAPILLEGGFKRQAYPENWFIWADLNLDGDFSDPGELLFSLEKAAKAEGTLLWPKVTAKVTTRLRVAMKYNLHADPCGAFAYGEVEDYPLVLSPEDPFLDKSAVLPPGTLSRETEDGLIYPNPASDLIQVLWTSEKEGMQQLIVTDLYGKPVRTLPVWVSRGANALEIPVAEWPSGVYWVKAGGKTRAFVKK
ncbi:MAG: S8 family serine peptidase [Haliscomenobacter sp.]|nr:S8 family serine peptidase [Haliscomenobacter sp.]